MIRKALFAIILALTVATLPTRGETSGLKEVAGRTLTQWSDQLDDSDRTVRLRALRSLSAFGFPASAALAQSLNHNDAAMRYVAAVAIGDIGKEAVEPAKKRLSEMVKSDPSLAVKTAAAYALCRDGMIDEYLPRLIETISYPERGMACSAAELIGKIGAPASPAIETLERLSAENMPGGKGDYHIGGAAKNALRKVRGNGPWQ